MITNSTIYQSPSSQDPFTTLGSAFLPQSIWYQTDNGFLFVRNTANTGWTLWTAPTVTVNTANLGLLPKSGGFTGGAMFGANGVMTADGTSLPFSSVPQITSKNSLAATLADLANFYAAVQAQISAATVAALSAIYVPTLHKSMSFSIVQSVGSNSSSIIPVTAPISGLTYSDGSVVNLFDIYGFATPPFLGVGAAIVSPYDNGNWAVDTVHGSVWDAYYRAAGTYQIYNQSLTWFIWAIKATA